MSAAELNLVVISTPQLGTVRAFYESVGVRFLDEQHGRGPPHVAATLPSGLVLEIYPSAVGIGPGAGTALDVRLGFAVDDIGATTDAAVAAGGSISRRSPDRTVLHDPDGRVVILTTRTPRSEEAIIAAAYWEHHRHPDESWWAWDLVDEVGRGRPVARVPDPLRLFVELAATAVDDDALGYLGAGPLEDLLRTDIDLDALERAIGEHDALRRAFAAAYVPSGLDPEREDRVRRVLGRPARSAPEHT